MNTSSTAFSVSEGASFSLCRDGHEERLELAPEPLLQAPRVGVRETERVSFILRTSHPMARALLWVQDIGLDPTSERLPIGTEDLHEYIWAPEDQIFLNHFGWSNLTIELLTTQGRQTLYTGLDIFATKLNEDRVRGMLLYLESRMEDITRSCFTATSQQTGGSAVGQTLLVLLQESEHQISRLRSLLPRFQRRKRSRLTPKSVITRVEEATQLTEKSVSWVLSHPDQLVLSSSPVPSSILFGNRYYDIPEVESDTLYEDVNVYENQIIAGYLESLRGRIEEIDRYAEGTQRSVERADYISVPTGFASFSRIQKEYEQKFCTRIREKCSVLERMCLDCAMFFEQHLPVTYTLPEMPKMTPGFLSAPHYYEIFEQIVAWYRLGKLTMSGERYLYGLRTLDKLYEFFCLYQTIGALEHEGWRLDEVSGPRSQSPELMWDARPAEQYSFVRLGAGKLRLFYEVSIHSRPNTFLSLVVSEYSVLDARPIYERRPDFLIELITENKSVFIIMDAKYSTRGVVWKQYLPQLTMKYVHGISSTDGGNSPVVALFVIYPRALGESSDRYDLFHQPSSDMFSRRPTFPLLGAINVSPNNSNEDSDKHPFPLAILLAKTLSVIKQKN